MDNGWTEGEVKHAAAGLFGLFAQYGEENPTKRAFLKGLKDPLPQNRKLQQLLNGASLVDVFPSVLLAVFYFITSTKDLWHITISLASFLVQMDSTMI
jgi:hypothetical protein